MRATATELPPTIDAKLRALRARLRRFALLEGGARLVLFALGFALATFVLDRTLEFPAPLRLVLLLLGAGGLGLAALRFIARPLVRVADDEAVALRVERAHPELCDELISAVQLARLPPERRGFHSEALARRVLAEAEERARSIDFERVASGRDLARFGMLTIAVAALVLELAWSRPREARIWLERMIFLSDAPWPRSVELAVEVHPRVVARGDDLTVSARVLRGRPSRVAILPEFPGSGRREEVAMVQTPAGYRATFENVDEPFSFVVEGGDYRSQRFSVEVKERPRLEALEIRLEYPAYTGLPVPEEPIPDGNLKVPAGTRVRFLARASQPLLEAEVRFSSPAAVEIARAPGIVGDGERRAIAGEFVVKDATAWSFRLVSEEGFENAVAAQYSIRALPDRLPEVRIVRPARARIALAVEIKDDYRPLGAALVLAVGPRAGEGGERGGEPEAPAEARERRIPLPGLPREDASAREASIAYALALEPFALRPGDRFEISAREPG